MTSAIRRVNRDAAEKMGCNICKAIVRSLPEQKAFYISPGDHIIGERELNEMRRNGVAIPGAAEGTQ